MTLLLPLGSDTTSLSERILRASFVGENREAVDFCKSGVCLEPPLMYEAAKELANNLPKDTNAICGLATSGIAFGTVLSQVLKLPLHLYRAKGWDILDGTRRERLFVLPSIPTEARVLLADSHMRTGRTASCCTTHLLQRPGQRIKINGLVTLVGLDHLPRAGDRIGVNEFSVARISQHREVMASIFKDSADHVFAEKLTGDSRVWRQTQRPTDIGQKSRPVMRLRNLMHRSGVLPDPIQLDAALARRLMMIPELKTDPHIWDIFANPDLLVQVGQIAMTKVGFTQYDAFVGVNSIGTALAWAIAYYSSFAGPILSSYENPEIAPACISAMRNKRVLLVQGRMITGQDTEEAVDKAEELGAEVTGCLSLLWMPNAASPKRRGSLDRLSLKIENWFTFAKV